MHLERETRIGGNMSFDLHVHFNMTQIKENLEQMDGHTTFWFVFICIIVVFGVVMILFLIHQMCSYACFCVGITAKSTKRRVYKLLESRDQRKARERLRNEGDETDERHEDGEDIELTVEDEDVEDGEPTDVQAKKNAWATIVAYFRTCDRRPRDSIITTVGDNVDINASSL